MGWAAPVAQVITGLAGPIFANRGQNNASRAQERSMNAQLALERERDAARGQRYNQAYGDYQKEKAQYDEIRRAMLAHYGVNVGGGGGGAPAGGGGANTGFNGGAVPPAGGLSLGDVAGGGGFGGGPAVAPAEGDPGAAPPTNAGGGDQFDWRNYGVR